MIIPHNWRPRGYQRAAWDYFENGGKRAVLIWHRRAGKDEIALHMTATKLMQRPATYWHLLPQAEQARKAIWDAVNPSTGKRRIDEAFPEELRARTVDKGMFIQFKNGSTWQVVGSDNFNSLVGAPPLGVVFSEYALADPTSWAIIRPILTENGGWAMFITTPRGRNHAKMLFDLAANDTSGTWFAERLTALDTKRFTVEQLASEEAEYVGSFGEDHGRALFEQEYLCSWDSAILGAYYGRLILDAEQQGRVTAIPHEPNLPVWTAWDLGFNDSTTIWFAQAVGGEVRLIDCYSNNQQAMPHYVQLLQAKPYTYAGHLMPHDIGVHEYGTGKTRKEQAESLGLKNLVEVPNIDLLDGINAVRSFLPRCWFDEKGTRTGIEALRTYRSEWDETAKVLKPRPVHDWASHYADAFRYLALGLDAELGMRLSKKAVDRYRKPQQRTRGGGWMAA